MAFFWWTSKPVARRSCLYICAYCMRLSRHDSCPTTICYLFSVPRTYICSNNLDTSFSWSWTTFECKWGSSAASPCQTGANLGERYVTGRIVPTCHGLDGIVQPNMITLCALSPISNSSFLGELFWALSCSRTRFFRRSSLHTSCVSDTTNQCSRAMLCSTPLAVLMASRRSQVFRRLLDTFGRV